MSDCQESYPEGQIVELTVQENSGYVLDYWLENGNVRLGNPPTVLSVTMDATKTVTAKFTPLPGANVHISPSSSGNKVLGTVENQPVPVIDCPTDCLEQLDPEVNITLTAKRKPGYKFVRWEDDNSLELSTANPYTFEIAYAHEVYAVFEPYEFKLAFPLDGKMPYILQGQENDAVPVTAVMDHSLSGKYYTGDGRNQEIVAFNGLVANGTEHAYSGNVYCYDIPGVNPFPGINYQYIFTIPDERSEICYDEHPGYDFGVSSGTNVLAPARGKLRIPTSDPVNGNVEGFNTFFIEHEDEQGNPNGYSTWFLHCSSLTQDISTQIQQNGFATVLKDDHIAESGSAGTGAAHLHFEVRMDGYDDENVIDPYGESLWE